MDDSPTPSTALSASLPALPPAPAPERHEWLAGRIRTLLVHFYQPGLSTPEEEAVLDDWLAVLDGIEERWIEEACIDYLRDPRRGRGGSPLRPLPADVYDRARSARAKATYGVLMAVKAAIDAEIPDGQGRVKPARVAEIMRAAGFDGPAPSRMPQPRRFGGGA